MHSNPKTTFLATYRKAQTPQQTHFCPGCGHGNILKFADEALCDFGVADRAIWVSPVGCGGLTDSYMSVSHILAAHGRASAVATAVKRLHRQAIVVASQGDGDLASIGLLEAIHAANRGENITVLFINNANFAMTGGQLAPTSWIGQQTATSPNGRVLHEHGAPLKICEILNQLEGPAFIARCAIGTCKQIIETKNIIRKAIRNQIDGHGYSFVEILSPCPSNWHCSPGAARQRIADTMVKTYPLGIFRDESRRAWIEARHCPEPYTPAGTAEAFARLAQPIKPSNERLLPIAGDVSICCSGFGGQGIMTLGRALSQIALASGYETTWMPSYGPEMRGGAANCFVRISQDPIAAPIVDVPDYLIAMNAPAFEKFSSKVSENGAILFDIDRVGDVASRSTAAKKYGICATQIATQAGEPKSANFALLGAFLKCVGADLSGFRVNESMKSFANHWNAIEAGFGAL